MFIYRWRPWDALIIISRNPLRSVSASRGESLSPSRNDRSRFVGDEAFCPLHTRLTFIIHAFPRVKTVEYGRWGPINTRESNGDMAVRSLWLFHCCGNSVGNGADCSTRANRYTSTHSIIHSAKSWISGGMTMIPFLCQSLRPYLSVEAILGRQTLWGGSRRPPRLTVMYTP